MLCTEPLTITVAAAGSTGVWSGKARGREGQKEINGSKVIVFIYGHATLKKPNPV